MEESIDTVPDKTQMHLADRLKYYGIQITRAYTGRDTYIRPDLAVSIFRSWLREQARLSPTDGQGDEDTWNAAWNACLDSLILQILPARTQPNDETASADTMDAAPESPASVTDEADFMDERPGY